MKTLNTSFNQVRMDSRVSEYSTYPNAIAVNEKTQEVLKVIMVLQTDYILDNYLGTLIRRVISWENP